MKKIIIVILTFFLTSNVCFGVQNEGYVYYNEGTTWSDIFEAFDPKTIDPDELKTWDEAWETIKEFTKPNVTGEGLKTPDEVWNETLKPILENDKIVNGALIAILTGMAIEFSGADKLKLYGKLLKILK